MLTSQLSLQAPQGNMDPSGGGVSNGYYGDSSGGTAGGNRPQQHPKDDFEDYMWMANEEEAEKEVLVK